MCSINDLQNKQRGGTVLGLVIGLVIGLAIAVVVALIITNTSIPFGNKLVKQEKGMPLASSQIDDPNKPLYGNNEPAKQAAKEFVKEVEPSLAINKPVPEKAAPPSVAPKEEVKEGAKEAELKNNTNDKFTYYLQTGAFRDSVDVDNTKAKLALLGFEAQITEKQDDAGVLYRVRVGPFAQIEAMNRARSKLIEGGIDAVVMRFSKQ